MAPEAEACFFALQQSLVFGKVDRMTGRAAPFLSKRLMNNCFLLLLFDILVTSQTKIRRLILEQLVNFSPVGRVARSTGAVLDR